MSPQAKHGFLSHGTLTVTFCLKSPGVSWRPLAPVARVRMMLDVTDYSHSCHSGPGYGLLSKASTRKIVAASPEPHKEVLSGLWVYGDLNFGGSKKEALLTVSPGLEKLVLSTGAFPPVATAEPTLFSPQGFVSSMPMEELMALGSHIP